MRNKKSFLRLAVIMMLCIALVFAFTACKKDKGEAGKSKDINPLTGLEIENKLESARPLQVSIDNVGDALPQSWISKADIIYEVPVEGRQTRLQALYYGEFPEDFGPIRSTRPYFVDIAREYKAVFLAHGWSPQAKDYLLSGVIPYINAMNNDIGFYRVSDKSAPHNSYVSWENVKAELDEKGWLKDDVELKFFKFADISEEDDEDSDEEKGTAATYIAVNYGASSCEYTYDEETNLYTRTRSGNKYIDKETGESVTVSNILVQRVSSSVLDSKGRLEIDMCAGGKAALYTGGKVVEGTWSRADLDSRTIFVDNDGNEFELTPGTTWVQLADQSCSVTHK